MISPTPMSSTGGWIRLEELPGQPSPAIESATEINRRRRHEDPDARGDREHHRRPARIAMVSSIWDAPLMRNAIPPGNSISIATPGAVGRIVTSVMHGRGAIPFGLRTNRRFQRHNRSTPKPYLAANRATERPLRSIRSRTSLAWAAVHYDRFDFDFDLFIPHRHESGPNAARSNSPTICVR